MSNPIATPEPGNIFLTSLTAHNNKAQTSIQESHCFLIAGRTGTGKSRSMKNLPPEKTLIFNLEAKPLTFPGATAFKDRNIIYNPGNQPIYTIIQSFTTDLKKALAEPSIDYIVIDSLSKYFEILLILCKKTGGKGYDVWNMYNDSVFEFMELIKRSNGKFIFLMALDELVGDQQPNGMIVNSRRVKVAGKVWEGQIESQFSTVLFTDIIQPPAGSQDRPQYKFITYSDGTTSTKTPEDMFKTKHIDNDLMQVVKLYKERFQLT